MENNVVICPQKIILKNFRIWTLIRITNKITTGPFLTFLENFMQIRLYLFAKVLRNKQTNADKT